MIDVATQPELLRRTLTFEENDSGEDPVAYVDGKPVFPDEGNEVRIEPGETWVCDVIDKGTYGFARAVEPLTDDKVVGHLVENPEAFQELLTSPKGRKLRASVERWAKAYVRDEVGDRLARQRERIEDLERRLSNLEDRPAPDESAGRDDEASTTFGPAKPTLADGEDPDHEFIAHKILHQLYVHDYWGRRHTSGEEFKKGALRGTDGGEIEDVVANLVAKGLLIEYPKSPDRRYSLNPERADAIRDALDVDGP